MAIAKMKKIFARESAVFEIKRKNRFLNNPFILKPSKLTAKEFRKEHQ
jgi:hypothetical protein